MKKLKEKFEKRKKYINKKSLLDKRWEFIKLCELNN